jgi:hypothetical protein
MFSLSRKRKVSVKKYVGLPDLSLVTPGFGVQPARYSIN